MIPTLVGERRNRLLAFAHESSDEGVEDLAEHVDVGLDPAEPVDDENRRGALAGQQPRALAHQRGRLIGVTAQVRHDLGDLRAGRMRTRAGEPLGGRHREVPVDGR